MPRPADAVSCVPPSLLSSGDSNTALLKEVATLTNTVQRLTDENEKLRSRVQFLESSARLRAAALVPPSPSTRGDMAISPVKVLLEQSLGRVPSPDVSTSRKLDMVDAFDSPTSKAPPCATSPFVIQKPTTDTDSPGSLPLNFDASFQPPDILSFDNSKSPRALIESPYSLPLTPSNTKQEEVQETLTAMMLPDDKNEGAPGCPRSPESPRRSSSSGAMPKNIGSLLSKVFGGADITVVAEESDHNDDVQIANETAQGGVLSSPEGDNWFPALPQPLLTEERWVSRGTYPSMSAATAVPPGLPPPPESIQTLDPVLESKSLFKYLDHHNQFVGFYNASRDRMFTLTFVFKYMADGSSDIELSILPGESKLVCHKSDFDAGYEVTVRYGIPTMMDVFGGESLEERADCDKEFPPRQISICRGWEGRSTQRRWSLVDSCVVSSNFLTVATPNCIRLTSLADICLTSIASILCEQPFVSFLRSLFSVSDDHRHARLFSGLFATTIPLDCYLPFIAYAPAFSSNLTEQNDFWPSFFHKAHAKLHGSYISGRKQSFEQVMRAVTGADVTTAAVDNNTAEIVLMHRDEGRQVCLLSCTDDNGLLKGAGYFVLQSKQVDGTILLKIRNPWQDARLWNGKWGRSSQLWMQNHTAERVGMCFEEDGGVWIESDELIDNFDSLCVIDMSTTIVTTNSVCIKTEFVSGIPNLGIALSPSFSGTTSLSFRSLLQTDSRSNSWEVSNWPVTVFASPARGGGWERVKVSGLSILLDSNYQYCVIPCSPMSFSGQQHLLVTSSQRNVATLNFTELSPSVIHSLFSGSPEQLSVAPSESPLVLDSTVATDTQTSAPLLARENVTTCLL